MTVHVQISMYLKSIVGMLLLHTLKTTMAHLVSRLKKFKLLLMIVDKDKQLSVILLAFFENFFTNK